MAAARLSGGEAGGGGEGGGGEGGGGEGGGDGGVVGALLEPVAARVDAAMLGVGQNVRAFASGVKKQAEDPWSVEDVWVIFLMRWVINDGRRAIYDALDKTARQEKDADDDPRVATERFDASVFGWLEGPLKALNTTWIMLYLHDNASRMFMVEAGAGVESQGQSPTCRCSGAIASPVRREPQV